MRRSPNRWASNPLTGAKHNRLNEKTVTKKVTALMLTPKVRANVGSAGETTP